MRRYPRDLPTALSVRYYSRRPGTATADVPCTRTALMFAATNSHSSWYEPPTTAIVQACMELPGVLVRFEQSLPLLVMS